MTSHIGEADVLVTGYYEFDGSKEKKYSLKECCYYSNDEIREAYIDGTLAKPFKTVWGKLYKRNAVNNCFDESFISGEDGMFNLVFLTKVKSVAVLHYCGYHKVAAPNSITHICAYAYTDVREHKYLAEKEKLLNTIKKDWGWTPKDFLSVNKKSAPTRYYKEIINLLQFDSPYSKKEVLQKINEIHADKEFVHAILANSYRDLSMRDKIVRLSVQLNSSRMTRVIFKAVLQSRSLRR